MHLRLTTLLLALLLCLASPLAAALSVVFINPGKSDELYWVTAARAMEAAARSLDIKLEVIYAGRIHQRVFDVADEISARPPAERPDFVVFSNDYGAAPRLLRQFETAGIRSFLAFSGIAASAERNETGAPRAQLGHWLGSLEPRAEDAGYLTARALVERGRKARAYGADGKLHMIALGGDRSTTSSILRNEGMMRAVAEAHDTVLEQTVYAAWTRDKAKVQAAVLFRRYPQARLVWAGNDLMAFGAMDAWQAQGGEPGKDAWFSGVNTSTEALDALKSGRLAALAGGHFIAGAWSLVMLYDYANGHDFASEGLEQTQFMFTLFDPRQADLFLRRFAHLRFDGIDFRRFSKTHNPRLKRYDFNFRQLLR